MYDISMEIEFEKCSPQKERLDVIPPFCVIHYITDGEGYFNGKKLSLGQFFLVDKNNRMEYFPDREHPWSYIYVRLFGDDVKDFLRSLGIKGGIYTGTFSDSENLFRLLDLYKSISENHTESRILKKSIANLFVLLNTEQIGDQQKPASERHALEIKAYIDANYHKKLTMEDVAKKFFLSRAYIRNIFVRHFGLSTKQYLQQVRMKRAGELLTETNLAISIIARSIGYEDSLLFSKLFSAYFGMSPTSYRDTQKNCSSV